ncbi:hypothetical protein Sjap_010976 [Stephania japonica]|uniref:Uncharacterized protein n=1 Tax=Stephania japonica TaxID=461633 RepID=A0AAP0JAN8_9MAGN
MIFHQQLSCSLLALKISPSSVYSESLYPSQTCSFIKWMVLRFIFNKLVILALEFLDSDHDGDDLWDDDTFDLDREWHKRHDQFHKIGCRDCIIAGKETSDEEGFNNGFNESVLVGYKWGLVRGVTR